MDDLDPAAAASLDDLAACLKRIHLLADEPTYRALEQATVHANEPLPGTRLKRVTLTRSTISDVLRGRKFPGKAFLLTFVDACGIDLENDRRWEQAWDRLAAQDRQASAGPGEAEKIRQENEALRQENEGLHHQLTTAEHQAEAAQDQARSRGTSVEQMRRQLEELQLKLIAAEHRADATQHQAGTHGPAVQAGSQIQFVTLHPRTYNDCRTIAEPFREGDPVVMIVTEMADSDAKRLVDFSAGLIFGLRGSIERITNKTFLLSPANVEFTAEDKAWIAERAFIEQRSAPSSDPDIGEAQADSLHKEDPHGRGARPRGAAGRWFRTRSQDDGLELLKPRPGAK